MRRFTRDELQVRDATGRGYAPRKLAVKVGDTVVRSIGVVMLLVLIGLLWEAFH